MNLNWDSLLEPIFLFILSLIAGTLWVIIPTGPAPKATAYKAPATMEPARMAAKPAPVERPPLPLQLMGTQKQLGESTGALRVVVDQVQMTDRELNQLKQQNRELAATLDTERQALEALRVQLRSLQQQQPASVPGQPARLAQQNFAQQNKEIAMETEALRKALAQQEIETVRLESQLAGTKAKSDGDLPYVPRARAADKLPVPIDLIHNRAIPITKDGYKMQGRMKLTGPMTATRISEGETIAEIHAADSAFQKMLGKIKPEKEYLSVLLNADSFEMFREVRRMARQRGIDIGWEPADTSAGKIDLVPVHMTKRAAKRKESAIRITPILH